MLPGGDREFNPHGTRSADSGIAIFPVFFQEGIEQGFGPPEAGAFQLLNRFGEVDQGVLCRHVQNAERAGDA
jgi:hypothetical protein